MIETINSVARGTNFLYTASFTPHQITQNTKNQRKVHLVYISNCHEELKLFWGSNVKNLCIKGIFPSNRFE